jgi:uncharacterized membrane protein
MILQWLRRAWQEFFFTPQIPTPVSLFRFLYGLCVLATIILLHPDWLNWFGVHAWVSVAGITRIEPGVRLNFFMLLPQDDRWIAAFFWFFLVAALLLTVGLWTRVSSIVVFLCLASIQQRNLLITHGGDTFLRVAGFFLMFAPSGAVFSIDRLIQIRRGLRPDQVPKKEPWAQRMIQIELALVYFISFWWKMKGDTWTGGTALYYVTHLHGIARFPLPQFLSTPTALQVGGWLTLIFECSFGLLIWFKPFRYPLLLTGLCFHLCLEYALNIPMFQWDILSAYVLFVDPADLARVWQKVSRHPSTIKPA